MCRSLTTSTVSVFVSVRPSYLNDINRQPHNSCNPWNRMKGRLGKGYRLNELIAKGLGLLP